MLIVLEAVGVNVSNQTIIRRMKENQLYPRRAVRKFFLTEQHIKNRFEFAALYADRDVEWWRSVIYSDDKTFGFVTG